MTNPLECSIIEALRDYFIKERRLYTVKQIRGFSQKSLTQIVKEHHCGYNPVADYKTIVNNRKLTNKDIAYIKSVLENSNSQYGYDTFPDRGGIDICMYLLEEVIKLRGE